jgi:hypothetical protein
MADPEPWFLMQRIWELNHFLLTRRSIRKGELQNWS